MGCEFFKIKNKTIENIEGVVQKMCDVQGKWHLEIDLGSSPEILNVLRVSNGPRMQPINSQLSYLKKLNINQGYPWVYFIWWDDSFLDWFSAY